ncbi:MAG: glycosyltransferase family 1 protein [Planctomycetota bacterium]|jgi:glycosyltransferase involved in cell wall biosynthesis|nr:glycosyltransferase family 1 protein [Planctomycetota bacterium]
MLAIDLSPVCGAWTGVGRYVDDLTTGLVKAGTPFQGVYQGHHGQLEPRVATRAPHHRYDLITGRIGLLFRLGPLLRQHGITCYHATSTIGVPRAWSGRMIVTVHDCFPLTHPQWFPARQRRLFHRLLLQCTQRSATVITPSHDSADTLRQHGISSPCVIPHGIAEPAPLPQGAAPNAKPYMLTVGAIEPRKGLAFLATVDRGSLEWIHIGSTRHDPQNTIRQTMVRAGAKLLGHVDEATRQRYLAHARVFAMPSLAEGFGYPLLEAMNAGTPVVATKLPVFDEFAPSAFLLEHDPTAWRDRLANLNTSDQARCDHINQGREAAKRLSLNAMVDGHRTAYGLT